MDHVRRRTASTSLEWLLLGSPKRKRKRNTRRNTLAQHCSAVPKYMFWASSHTFHSLGGSGRFWALSRSNGEQWCEHRRNWDVLGPSNTRTSHRTFLNYHTAGIARVLPCLIFVFFYRPSNHSKESYRVTIISSISVSKLGSQVSCGVPSGWRT